MPVVKVRAMLNKAMNRIEIRLGRVRLWSGPVEIGLEPTLQCNSNCIMCNRNHSRQDDKKANGFLGWEILRSILPDLASTECVCFSGFGEPLLHPDYIPMLSEIKRRGPYVYAFTNGLLMKKEIGRDLVDAGIDMICVSMGGANRETYRKIRGIDGYDTVVENITSIHEYKKVKGTKKPLLSFNIVAMNSILPELKDMVRLAARIGVQHIALPNLAVQGDSVRPESIWLNTDLASQAFGESKSLASQYGIEFVPPSLAPHVGDCRAFFKRLSVNWDGTVMTCAMERHIVGKVPENTIKELWNSPGMQRVRRDYMKKGIAQICPNCFCWDCSPEVYLKPSVNDRKTAIRL